jgi:hypothetical protein
MKLFYYGLETVITIVVDRHDARAGTSQISMTLSSSRAVDLALDQCRTPRSVTFIRGKGRPDRSAMPQELGSRAVGEEAR